LKSHWKLAVSFYSQHSCSTAPSHKFIAIWQTHASKFIKKVQVWISRIHIIILNRAQTLILSSKCTHKLINYRG
jgi:hypothetical protein